MKITFISDMHTMHPIVNIPIKGDVLIIGGDSVCSWSMTRFGLFIEWINYLEYDHKIIIAGNHDGLLVKKDRDICLKRFEENNIIYLEDKEIVIDGIKIYGTPWTGKFFNWYFMLDRDKLKLIWDAIPEDTDILVTHMPPEGIFGGDFGCPHLLKKVLDSNIKYHLYGHMHDFGCVKKDGIWFMNGAVCNNFEIELKEGLHHHTFVINK